DITLYWLTNTATSSARLYWENQGRSPLSAGAQKTSEISLPVAITVFPGELYRAPETWDKDVVGHRLRAKGARFHHSRGVGHGQGDRRRELNAARSSAL